MKTLAQLKTSVYNRGYEDDQAGRIAGFANDVVRELLNDHRYLFAATSSVIVITPGTSTYSLPADVQHVESVRLTYAQEPYSPELDPVTADEMLELLNTDPAGGSTGGPLVWAQTAADAVSVYPAPIGGTMTVRYQHVLDEVDDDADELPVPDSMYDLIVLGVCKRLAERERQWDAATRWEVQFDARLLRLKSQLGLGQRQNAGRVGYSGDKQYAQYDRGRY